MAAEEAPTEGQPEGATALMHRSREAHHPARTHHSPEGAKFWAGRGASWLLARRGEGPLALRFVASVGAAVDQYNTDSARIKAFRPDGFRIGLSILKLGTVEVCSMEVGTAQVRTPQVGTLQFGILKMGLAKVGSGKVCVRQLGLTQIGVLQIGAL